MANDYLSISIIEQITLNKLTAVRVSLLLKKVVR